MILSSLAEEIRATDLYIILFFHNTLLLVFLFTTILIVVIRVGTTVENGIHALQRKAVFGVVQGEKKTIAKKPTLV